MEGKGDQFTYKGRPIRTIKYFSMVTLKPISFTNSKKVEMHAHINIPIKIFNNNRWKKRDNP